MAIYKIQRPLNPSSEDENFVLAYNKSHSIYGQFPMSDEQMAQLFDVDEYKIYVHGKYNERTTCIDIKGRAPDQEW